VVVEGLRKTRPELAVKIAGIEPGTPYRSQLLEDAYLRMVSSAVFSDVGYPTVRMSAGGEGVDAVLKVDEPGARVSPPHSAGPPPRTPTAC
jgi:hypothetical protein